MSLTLLIAGCFGFFTLTQFGDGPAIGALAVLRHQALKPELASRAEQVRADLALLELANENPLRAPCQKPGEIVLSKVQGQLPQVLSVHRQDVGGVKLNL